MDGELHGPYWLFRKSMLRHKVTEVPYLDVSRRRFDIDRLLKDSERWSSGERQLSALAMALWGYRGDEPHAQFEVRRAVDNLSDHDVWVFLEAIAIRAGLLLPGQHLGVDRTSEASRA